jgi:hypothetical protein
MNRAKNIEPNDERQVEREVAIVRRRARALSAEGWLAEVNAAFRAAATRDRVTPEEAEALAEELRCAGSEPQVLVATGHAVGRVPRDVALLMVAWIVRRRRAARRDAA